jgi:hypothetical protein
MHHETDEEIRQHLQRDTHPAARVSRAQQAETRGPPTTSSTPSTSLHSSAPRKTPTQLRKPPVATISPRRSRRTAPLQEGLQRHHVEPGAHSGQEQAHRHRRAATLRAQGQPQPWIPEISSAPSGTMPNSILRPGPAPGQPAAGRDAKGRVEEQRGGLHRGVAQPFHAVLNDGRLQERSPPR